MVEAIPEILRYAITSNWPKGVRRQSFSDRRPPELREALAHLVGHSMRRIEPAPADHLEISEVGLPELVGRRGLVLELVRRLDHDEGWAVIRSCALSRR